jgi:hypothetical protein
MGILNCALAIGNTVWVQVAAAENDAQAAREALREGPTPRQKASSRLDDVAPQITALEAENKDLQERVKELEGQLSQQAAVAGDGMMGASGTQGWRTPMLVPSTNLRKQHGIHPAT